MNRSFLLGAHALLVVLLSTSVSLAQPSRRVNRTMNTESDTLLTDGLRYVYQPGVKVLAVKSSEVINKRFVEDRTGAVGAPAGTLKYADIALTVTLEHWCGKLDRKDIVKLIENDDSNANAKNKIMQISIREARDFNFYACAGGGTPEQQDVLVVLPLINGIGRFFEEDRITAYNILGKNPSGIQVKVLYNQSKQTFKFDTSN